ncbi:hypothetical protein E2320_004979, partial [Naja naja]
MHLYYMDNYLDFTGFSTTDEFMYEIQFESERMNSHLKSAIAINLVKKEQDLKTGIVTLIFNIIFTPYKSMRYPEPYTAYFLPGSDPEFTVSPQAGELLPLDTAGTCITVGFKPSMYSKKHKAT